MNNNIKIITEKSTIDTVVDVIREKRGISENIKFIDITNNIKNIENLNAMDATATAEDILEDKTAYIKGELVTGNISTAEIAELNIKIDNNGLITATANQPKGYISVSSNKTGTLQLAFQAAKTITPTTIDQVAVNAGNYVGGDITVKGDSNLIADNIKNGVNVFGIEGNYINENEDKNMEDNIILNTISVCNNNRVTRIGSHAFDHCESLTTVSFPTCTYIGNSAFEYCTSLTSINFPVCTYIGSNAFGECTSLTSVNFPVCAYIDRYAFYFCTSLTSVNFPVCTYIGNCAFNYCESLTSANFPACTYIDNYAFEYCRSLISVSFPVCTNIGEYAFYYCESLTTVSFPACTNVGSNAFEQCFWLTTANFPACTDISEQAFIECAQLATANFPVCTDIGERGFWGCYLGASTNFPVCKTIGSSAFGRCGLDKITLPACTYIGEYAFEYCYNLSQIYLTASSVCTLANSNAFSDSFLATATIGSIFVPSSLVTAYKSATNWVFFSDKIFGI